MENKEPLQENNLIEKPNKYRTFIIAIVLGVLLIAICAVLFTMTTSSTARARRQVELGNRYLTALEYDQAISAYEEVLSIDPKNVDAFLGLIEVYRINGNYEELSNTFERALASGLSEEDLQRIETAYQNAINNELYDESVQENLLEDDLVEKNRDKLWNVYLA